MLALVLSEKFYTQSLARDLSFTGSDTEVIISNLSNIQSIDRSPDIVVLDLDFGEQTTSADTIPLFNSNLNNARDMFDGLPDSVPRFLNNGGVVITLLAERIDTFGLNQPTNYDWLDELGVANIVSCSSPRAPIDVISNIPPVRRYFEHVSVYEYSIRLNSNVVSQPEILAKHQIDNETVAVDLSEYSDPHNVVRRVPGNLLLLPQPELNRDNFASVLRSLVSIGTHFAQREELEAVTNEDAALDIELLLEKGEGETIEFKQQFPETAHDMEKELVAFANMRGGTVAIGITDEAEVVGVNDVDDVRNRVAGVAKKIQPSIEPNVESHTVQGEQLVSVTVDKKDPGVTAYCTSQNNVYRRFGPTCRELSMPEIERRYL